MSITATIQNNTFSVREECSISIVIESDQDLHPGDRVEIQFPNSWSILSGPSFTRAMQADDPGAEHHVQIAVEVPGAEFAVTIKPNHLNFPEGSVRHGRLITGTLRSGMIPKGTAIRALYANTFAPYVTETETVLIRVNGEAPVGEVELIVTPGPAVRTRVICPSGVEPGREFEVLIVTLDEFDNCSCSVVEGVDLTLDNGRTIAGDLRVKGSARVPVTLAEEEIYRFRFGDVVSNVVRVKAGCKGPFWGDLHVHTKLSDDAQGNDPYGYARDVSGLDFAAVSDHVESLGGEGYACLKKWAEEANESGRFAPILADERNPKRATGHHNIYFRNQDALEKYQAHFEDGKVAGDDGYLDELPADTVMLIPHHTGIAWRRMPGSGIGSSVDWNALGERDYRPVMEIYSHHGQSETYDPQHVLAYEFNRMHRVERRSNVSVPGPYYAQEYLKRGVRIGFIASSDEHSGQAGRSKGGIAAVFAEVLDSQGIFDAVRSRNCYATTGERILVDFTAAGIAMGQEGARARGSNIELNLDVWGTDTLLRVEIMRYRFGMDEAFRPVLSEMPNPESLDASYRFEDELEADTVYYARVVQEPLEWPDMAWTSPIWVELEEK